MKYLRILSIALVTLTPAVVLASSRTLSDLVNFLIQYINAAIGLLVAIAILIYFIGTIGLLFQSGQGNTKSKGALKVYLGWGISILFVIISIWGIVKILQDTFFGDTASGQSTSNNSTNVPTFHDI